MTTHFTPVDDFSRSSLLSKGVCPITGLPKQTQPRNEPPRHPDTLDEFVFRGPEIVFFDGRGEVSLGFFDVRPEAIRHAAREHLGMVTGEDYSVLQEKHDLLFGELGAALVEIESLRTQVSSLTLGNAELIVQMSDIQDELTEAYEELYGQPQSEDVLDLAEEEIVYLDDPLSGPEYL